MCSSTPLTHLIGGILKGPQIKGRNYRAFLFCPSHPFRLLPALVPLSLSSFHLFILPYILFIFFICFLIFPSYSLFSFLLTLEFILYPIDYSSLLSPLICSCFSLPLSCYCLSFFLHEPFFFFCSSIFPHSSQGDKNNINWVRRVRETSFKL